MKKFIMVLVGMFVLGLNSVGAVSLQELQDTSKWYKMRTFEKSNSILYVNLDDFTVDIKAGVRIIKEATYMKNSNAIAEVGAVFNGFMTKKGILNITFYDEQGKYSGMLRVDKTIEITPAMAEDYLQAFHEQDKRK